MKSWLVIAAALAASGVAHAASLEDASLRQVTPQALGSVQAVPYFHGLATSEKTDWSIVLEAPRCYWFSGVSAAGAGALSLYLWSPGGARIATESSDSGEVTLAWCAQESGMYRFQAKIGGRGEYVVGVFGKHPEDSSTALPVELPRLPPPPPSPDLPPPEAIVVPPVPEGPSPWYHDGAGWALTGVGAASLVAGIILAGTAASNFAYANDNDPGGGPVVPGDVEDARSAGVAYAAAGAVALAVGTGLVIGGIVKFTRHAREASKPALTLSPRGPGRSVLAAPLFTF